MKKYKAHMFQAREAYAALYIAQHEQTTAQRPQKDHTSRDII